MCFDSRFVLFFFLNLLYRKPYFTEKILKFILFFPPLLHTRSHTIRRSREGGTDAAFFANSIDSIRKWRKKFHRIAENFFFPPASLRERNFQTHFPIQTHIFHGTRFPISAFASTQNPRVYVFS